MDLPKSALELVDAEKQMVALIHSKGIFDNRILDLYRKIRSGYEKTLLNPSHTAELQDIEYHLWRLHYHLIDEFRRKIRNKPYPPGKASGSSIDKGGFELFLSEASDFYQKLIVKFRKTHAEISAEVERTCHRLFVCLGDLARYNEIAKRPNACEWYIAAAYYFEATRTWPHSGNPHNQLALLATYAGDAFLALYHCVRSLAVKEPFPDAWRNIMLLFEENRSIKLPSFSSKMQLDFLNPSRKSYLQNEDNNYLANSKLEDVWPLLVRTISFLLIRSSMEEFPCTLASALHCLEGGLAMDDARITVFLESYQSLDSSRRGPYRAIQLVSIFIFIVHTLTKDDSKPSSLEPLALAAIFICMGRITERCHKGELNTGSSPLLPSVLVFIEWLVGAVDSVETYDSDERVSKALSYFYTTLADLLEQNGDESDPDNTALWEDRELKGFYPLARVHQTLDFETQNESAGDYTCRNEQRIPRLLQAAKRISQVSKSFQLFNSLKLKKSLDSESHSVTEDEEVILFKPITRRNSAPPVYVPEPEKGSMQTPPAEEWLRHATSLSTRQNTEDTDSFSFYSTTSNKDSSFKDSRTHPHPAGPPSLSSWNIEMESESHSFSKQKLCPIEETVSTSLLNLSINEDKPVPSAPLLPDNAAWLRANPSFQSEDMNEADGILGAGPIIRSTSIGFLDSYHPPFLGMSSSEWLYRYRSGQNMGGGNHLSPIQFDAPSFVNFDLCDQWGNQFVSSPVMYLGGPQLYPSYGVEDQKRDKYFVGYQRPMPFPYVVEEPTLLQYLKDKEKERQLQPPRGPTFMGN